METPRALRAKKGFGQHFLVNPGIIGRIVDAATAGPAPGSFVEIGPGPGALTRPLLEIAHALTVIEADRDVWPLWRDVSGVRLIEGSALDHPPRHLVRDSGLAAPLRLVSNLPYNVGTAILRAWLAEAHAWDRMVLMFQSEVAEQILSGPGPGCGPLSVLAQTYARPRKLVDVAPGSFAPPPKVRSTVLVFEPAADPSSLPPYADLEAFLFTAFTQRRKKLAGKVSSAARERLAAEGLADVRAERVPFPLWSRLLLLRGG